MTWQIRTFRIDDAQRDAWKTCYEGLPGKGVYHCPEYIETLQGHLGAEAQLLVYGDEEEYVYYPYFRRRLDGLSIAPFCDRDLSRHWDITSSWYYGGPLLRAADPERAGRLVHAFLHAFRGYCADERIVSEFVRYDPLIGNHAHFLGHGDLVENRHIVFVDLTQSPEEIWKGLEGRCRTAVRKARRSGVEVIVTEDEADVGRFCEVYTEEMARKGAPAHYHFGLGFFRELFGRLGGRARLFCARVGGETVGASLCVFEEGAAAHDFLMATRHRSWGIQPNNLVLYESVLWAREKGLRIYDLQGGREGVYRFKRSFSRSERPFFVGAWVHDPVVYRDLAARKRAVSPGKDSFFPAYRDRDTN